MAHSLSHADPVEYADPMEYELAGTAGPSNPLVEDKDMDLDGEEDEEYKEEEEQVETPTIQAKAGDKPIEDKDKPVNRVQTSLHAVQ